jgi:uncharacterized repeat protein (TIGR01451 family)
MFQLQFVMAPTASADNACQGAFSGSPSGTLAMTSVPPGGSTIAAGSTIDFTFTWDPADWTDLDRFANCIQINGALDTSLTFEDRNPANDGLITDSLVVPATLQPGDTVCARSRLSGNPTGGNSTQKSNVLCYTIGDTPPPDVKISKAASDTTIVSGDTVQFTLTVENTGGDTATDVQVVDVVPAGLQITGTSAGCSVSNQTVTCDLGNIAAGGSKSVTITVKALDGACPNVKNQATVSASNEPGANTGNNTSNQVSIDVSCPTPDVKVSKSASSTSVAVGDSVTFTLVAENTGQATANNVVITDTIPAGMTITSAAGCSIAGQTVTCNLGDINAGGSKSVTVVVTATAGACPAVNNKATVTASNEPAGATGNNESNVVTVNVACPDPDVQIEKSAGAPATGVEPGDEFTYTIEVTNAGGADATGVTIHDSIPADLEIVSYPNNCSVSGNDLTCDLGTVAAGATESVMVTVRATEDACPLVTNRATVTATNEPSGNQGNNSSDDVTTLVNCEPPPPEEGIAVRIVKTNDADRDGDYSDNEEARRPDVDVPFLLVITNTGEDPWTIADLTDKFGGQTLNLLKDKCSSLKGITLQPGESATCNFTLSSYSPPAGDPKDNTAEVCVESMTGSKTDCDDDDSRVRSREVLGRTITPTKTPPGGTAFTGSEGTLGFGAIALSLLLLGSGLVWAGYRRRQQYDG